jgi:glycerate kinase
MRIVLAPDKFKGCLSAADVASAIASGVRSADPRQVEIDECPMADGGEGTVAALVAATGGKLVTRRVTGPLPDTKVDANFGMLGDGRTAVVEMAAASGLALLEPEDRNPLYTTTYGTGELLNAAVELGARNIILGVGGSATVDGGIGCAQATGHTIILEGGEAVFPGEPLVGQDLSRIVLVKRHRGERTDGVAITVACDVTNPLYGPDGAARVFGPQKGATPQIVDQLDESLRQLAARLGKTDLAETPGAGAAGGLGFGMMAFYGASLRRGVEIVAEAVRLRERLRGADLCITGEGKLDGQSAHGKTIAGVAKICRELHIPCIALAGSIEGAGALVAIDGLTAAFCICDRPMSLAESMEQSRPLLAKAAANAVRLALAWHPRCM